MIFRKDFLAMGGQVHGMVVRQAIPLFVKKQGKAGTEGRCVVFETGMRLEQSAMY